MNEGTQKYNEHQAKNTLTLVDIKTLRRAGITPYPFLEKLGKEDFSLRERLGLKK